MDEQYQAAQIESDAQAYWQDRKVFEVKEDISKEKFYCLAMFPYPSGYLHIGHVRTYAIADVIARYQRLKGKNVLQPMGWDAFGLPAENAAIKNKVAPSVWTHNNIEVMRGQLKNLGLGYDWRRELATCDPNYYRWEQWLFTRLFKKGLVYRKNAVVNWDPVDQTVLANEQVINGRGWRSDALVERREIPQWFLRITDYADELLNGLDKLPDWPEQVRTMQKNWIGRSSGVEVNFTVVDQPQQLMVFTTRPDTLFGVSYLAIAPTHALAQLAAKDNPEIQQFIDACANIKVAEADLATMPKTGIATPLQAIHPLTEELLPIWIANFVLGEYGSGAVMSVPAHDQRDYEFAEQYQLPIKQVIEPLDDMSCDLSKAAFTDAGKVVNSGDFSNIASDEAIEAIADFLEANELGKRQVNYRLRDWGVSRQRYWGAPIPIIHCPDCGPVAVPEKDLPVVLPTDIVFNGAQSPLASLPEFYETNCPDCGSDARRETDTFDTFMESSWYYSRYACWDQHKSMLDDRATYWTPVDHYIGGVEHAILHLLYARFLHKVLRDEGLLNSDEPFLRLLTQGMVLNDGAKMSKSKGNAVDPQSLIEQYGADTLRLFIIFAAPPEQSLEWSETGVEGAHRFLKRLWNFACQQQAAIKYVTDVPNLLKEIDWPALSTEFGEDCEALNNLRESYKFFHLILRKVNHDMETYQFNNIVSAAMKLLNKLHEIAAIADDSLTAARQRVVTQGLSILLRILSPIAPHISHHLWRDLGFSENIIDTAWPKPSKSALKTDHLDLIIQVNGKLRGRIKIASDASNELIEEMALKEENVVRFLEGRQPVKVIIVPGRLVNVVVK